MSKAAYDRPVRELSDWRMVETLLKLRIAHRKTEVIAKKLGRSSSWLQTLIKRIRWMASVTLGPGVPFGTTDQRCAKDFLAVWDRYEARGGFSREPYKPMSAEQGRAVSDAIRKVAHCNGDGNGGA